MMTSWNWLDFKVFLSIYWIYVTEIENVKKSEWASIRSESGSYSSDICWTNTVYRGRVLLWERVKLALWWQLQASFFFFFKKILLLPQIAYSTLVKQTNPLISPAVSRRSFNMSFVEFTFYVKKIIEVFFFVVVEASLVAQVVKRLPAVQETRVRSLSQEDPLEKEMATHSSTLAWKIPWIEDPGRLQSMGLQRVRHDWATSLHFTYFL